MTRSMPLCLGLCLTLSAQTESLFEQGRFAEAAQAADQSAAGELIKAKVALWSNDSRTAQQHLEMAQRLEPSSKERAAVEAELYLRQDRFAKAGTAYRAAGSAAMAEQMDLFAGRTPYRVEGKGNRVDLPFERVDPLPYFKLRVNGREAWLLLDTGSHEVVLDPEFATEAGVAITQTASIGVYAGGNKAESRFGRADTLQLVDWTVHDVPVNVLPTKRMSAAAGGKRVDGILGTALLYHFLSTIDYPAGRLTLRKKQSPEADAFRFSLKTGDSFPFWLAGTHYIVSWGKINGKGPMLFFLDTGLAGLPFTAPRETFEKAGIALPQTATAGVGGGAGKVSVAPVTIDELEFGERTQKRVTGLYGPFPEALRMRNGFEIAGIISHSFFRKSALTLDFESMRGYMRSTPAPEDPGTGPPAR